jgi:hypothetical protein
VRSGYHKDCYLLRKQFRSERGEPNSSALPSGHRVQGIEHPFEETPPLERHVGFERHPRLQWDFCAIGRDSLAGEAHRDFSADL